MTNEDRGLASADEETKERVAREGGKTPHEKRGLQATDEETREEVARKGGEA
jgi:general stress protein YciG